MIYNCEGFLLPPVIVHNDKFPEEAKRFYKKEKTYKGTKDGLLDCTCLYQILEDFEK